MLNCLPVSPQDSQTLLLSLKMNPLTEEIYLFSAFVSFPFINYVKLSTLLKGTLNVK